MIQVKWFPTFLFNCNSLMNIIIIFMIIIRNLMPKIPSRRNGKKKITPVAICQ